MAGCTFRHLPLVPRPTYPASLKGVQVRGVWRTPDRVWRVELVDDHGPAYRVWYCGGLLRVIPPQPAVLEDVMRRLGGDIGDLVED